MNPKTVTKESRNSQGRATKQSLKSHLKPQRRVTKESKKSQGKLRNNKEILNQKTKPTANTAKKATK